MHEDDNDVVTDMEELFPVKDRWATQRQTVLPHYTATSARTNTVHTGNVAYGVGVQHLVPHLSSNHTTPFPQVTPVISPFARITYYVSRLITLSIQLSRHKALGKTASSDHVVPVSEGDPNTNNHAMTNVMPDSSPNSPPRRARPHIPQPYLSTTFSPARQALCLASESAETRHQTLSQLTSLRRQISEYLHEEAPKWSHLTPALSQLTSALQTTQSATSLRAALASLSTSHDYPAQMAAVVARTARLSATVSLASSARSFAELLQSVRAIPPGTMPTRFLPHAAALHRARSAANTQPLVDVQALDDARADLDARHTNLLSKLQRALLAGIYSGTVPFDRNESLTQSMSSPHIASARTASVSTVAPPASVCPDLARAIDMLAGSGAAAKLLSDSARAKITALIRDAVLSESSPPARTVASLASSSFTAAATSSPTSFGSGLVFREPSTKRVACAAVFERVKFLMTGVLRRLSALADTVGEDMKEISVVVHSVWEAMEAVLVLFVKALLDFPNGNKVTKGGDTFGISLLPRSPRPSDTDATQTWDFGRAQSSPDSFISLVRSIPSLSPSIYNLEVIYSPLQMFVMNTNRLQESWEEKVQTDNSALPQLLGNAVELFLRAVQDDVHRFMKEAFGNRAGTLLQPLSMRQRGSRPAKGTHSLPPLPQSQAVIDVMASCLSLAIAVPSVASRLGEVINDDVIMPFSERAIYALKLAASWTDAGILLEEIEKTGNNGILVESVEVGNNEKPNHRMDAPSAKGGAFKTIYESPDITSRCLATSFDRRKQSFGHDIQLLTESEWNAVVRLLVTARFVIGELESCMGSGPESPSSTSPVDVSGFTPETPEPKRSGTLRNLLQDQGISSELHTAIVEAIQSTQVGCRVLRYHVIERGLALLHGEITLHCFSEVVRTLNGELQDPVNNQESSGSLQSVDDIPGHSELDPDAKVLSKPSSIFKASQIQLRNIDRESDGFSHTLNEYDEFGDPILTATDNVTDTDIEEYGFPNSLLLEQSDWKGGSKERTEEKVEVSVYPRQGHQAITKTDQRVVEKGRECGEQLKQRELCIKDNLLDSDRDVIFSQTDAGMGLGIRYVGKVRGKGDRDVATGARLFLDSVATLAADTVGWHVVESDYSVTEGASHSASECRTLLYSAGLL